MYKCHVDLISIKENSTNKCNNAYINNKINKDATNDKFSENIENIWHRRLGHVNNNIYRD